MRIYKLKNQIQNYAWGTVDFIPNLLAKKNDENLPCAELWLGAHPKAPSKLISENFDLKQFIQEFPAEVLGNKVQNKFGGKLPFLMKILSAATPLSIQAHPNKTQAENGFLHENVLEKPLYAFDRNYKDSNHKPELICALSPFTALCGFRPCKEIKELLNLFGMNFIIDDFDLFCRADDIKNLFSNLMKQDKKVQAVWIEKLVANLDKNSIPEKYKLERDWIKELQIFFPGDIGVLAPLLLNLIELQPEEALFLPAGVLHAYLKGSGIEIMANSDNVLRGGLTPKHIDVAELLKVLRFKGEKTNKIFPKRISAFEKIYQTPAPEFELSQIQINNDKILINKSGPEILLCLDGKSTLNAKQKTSFQKGESVIIPNDIEKYSIFGKAVIFRAKIANSNEEEKI